MLANSSSIVSSLCAFFLFSPPVGIACTGSGKTLAFLLPLLRHILDQPPLAPHESGPIGLILAPARELAYQIHLVCKSFTKSLGLK